MILSRADAIEGILLSADCGLWGQVPAPLRALSFSFDDFTYLITFKAEVDKEIIVADDDWEALFFVSNEISGDGLLGWEVRVVMEIVLVPEGQPLDPLPDGVVFLRAGEQVPEFYGGAMPHPRSRAHLIPHAPPTEEE
ncbi:MAG: hypothetical protein ACRYGI_09390 [Janthinobacterium lividum]